MTTRTFHSPWCDLFDESFSTTCTCGGDINWEPERAHQPKKYHKKPIEIQAMQLTDTNAGEVVAWINKNGGKAVIRGGPGGGSKGASVIVTTLEGREVATPGYQIIQGIRGEFYPCEESIFADSYEVSP